MGQIVSGQKPWRTKNACDSIATPHVDGLTFADLYHEYAERLFRYALARTRSRQIAEDIVGDTLLHAFEHRSQFDPSRGSLAGWIFGIANHEVVNQQRYHQRVRRLLTRLRPQLSPPDGLAEMVIRQEQTVEVSRAFNRLSISDQDVVALRFGAGLSSVEIAATLDISHSAARVRLHRAVQRLKAELVGSHDIESEEVDAVG